jgi:hypothetical protein
MSIPSRRRFLLGAATLTAESAMTGCFGSFGATTALWKFNKGVSDNKWLQWLVFLGLSILPVYELFVLGDVIVINTIEFYTGKNPIGASAQNLGGGRMLALSRDAKDPNLVRAEIRTEREGAPALVRVFFIEKQDKGLVIMDEQHRVVTRTTGQRGVIELFGPGGELLLSMDDPKASAVADAIEQGASPMAVLELHARATGRAVAIARASGPTAF